MPYDKKQSTILEFTENVPKTIILKTDPSRAKGKEYNAKVSGKPYTKWTYFTTEDEVFWAFEDFHKELQKFRAGDTITITYVIPPGKKYGIYKVEGEDGTTIPVTTDLQLLARENNKLIRMLIQKFDTFLNSRGISLSNEVVKNDPKEEIKREKTDTDLGF